MRSSRRRARFSGRDTLNPFDSPAAVRSSNQITTAVITFRERLGLKAGLESGDAKRWRQAAGEVVEKVRVTGVESAVAAKRFGDQQVDRATEMFRGREAGSDDGFPDQSRPAAAAEQAGFLVKGAAAGVASGFGTLFNRKSKTDGVTAEEQAPDTINED